MDTATAANPGVPLRASPGPGSALRACGSPRRSSLRPASPRRRRSRRRARRGSPRLARPRRALAEKASLIGSTCVWMQSPLAVEAELARALRRKQRRPSRSEICRKGPSIACSPAARAATKTAPRTKSQRGPSVSEGKPRETLMSAGPRIRLSSRGDPAAISTAACSPAADSISACNPIGALRDTSVSAASSSRSHASRSATLSTFGTITLSSRTHPAIARMSSSNQGVATPLTRTLTVAAAHAWSTSASPTAVRASAFSPGGTESSRSTTISSTPSVAAFSSLLAGRAGLRDRSDGPSSMRGYGRPDALGSAEGGGAGRRRVGPAGPTSRSSSAAPGLRGAGDDDHLGPRRPPPGDRRRPPVAAARR